MPDSVYNYVKQYIPDTKRWGVPAKRGGVMVSCNFKLVQKCPTSPKQFFDLENYPGDRMMPSFQPLVAIALALEATGMKPADIFPANKKKSTENVQKAIAALNKIKPSMKQFFSSSTTALQLLNSGTINIGALWNGTSQNAYAHPSSNMAMGATWNGAVTYAQWDVVYKNAPNAANAWKFLDWIYHHPENVAAYSNAAISGTSDPRAFAKLDPKVKQWLPSPTRKLPSVATDPVWYIRDPALKKTIDDFWTSFTTG